MQFNHSAVSLSEIDCQDKRFQITTTTEDDSLRKSIAELGLMNAPFLLRRGADYLIVAGFRRIAACRRLGWDRIFANVTKSEINDPLCAKLAINDNSRQRDLNLIEQSRAVRLLDHYFDQRADLLKAAGACNLPVNPVLIEKLRRLGRCSPAIHHALLQDLISLSMALDLGALAIPISKQLINLFSHLKVGQNKQREILLFMTEIAFREDKPLGQLFEESRFRDLLADTEMDRGLKAKKIRFYLKQRRYPRLTEAQQAYEQSIKELQLPPQVQLIPPKDFEGTHFSLSVIFSNHEELLERKQTIARLGEHPAIRKLLNNS